MEAEGGDRTLGLVDCRLLVAVLMVMSWVFVVSIGWLVEGGIVGGKGGNEE